MNLVFEKARNVYKRVQRGWQLTISPSKFYLYDKDICLHHTLSYAQEGEDMILARFFGEKSEGFYVDVGAHHPQRFSNTYLFYLRGWRGINIDAMPESMNIFNKIRPNDINLECAISDTHQVLNYYKFNEPALNGFCQEVAEARDGLYNYKILAIEEIETYTLSEVLDKHLPVNQKIDFLSIDVEGLDLQVIKSNNWLKYRPKIVLIEALNMSSVAQVLESDVGLCLQSQGYRLYAKAVNTCFFVEEG